MSRRKCDFIIDEHCLVSSCPICKRQWVAKQIKNEWSLLGFCKHLIHIDINAKFVLMPQFSEPINTYEL